MITVRNDNQRDPMDDTCNDDDSAWLNLVRYDSVHHPFVDLNGQLSLGFSGPSTLGPQWVHPRGVISTYDVVNPVLKLWTCRRGGTWQAARRVELISYPRAAVETGRADQLAVSATYAFCGSRSILAEFTLKNNGAIAVSVSIAWCGAGVIDDRRYIHNFYDGASSVQRELLVRHGSDAREIVVELVPRARCDLSAVGVSILSEINTLTPSVYGQPIWGFTKENDSIRGFAFQQDLSLEAGESKTFTFRISVTAGSQKPATDVPRHYSVTSCVSDRRRALIDDLSQLEGDLPRRGKLGLLRTSLSGDGGEFGENIASLCTSDSSDFSCSFFWDSLFTSAALSTFDPGAGQRGDSDGICQAVTS